MSKVGKEPVKFNKEQINVTIEKGGEFNYLLIKVKGPKGELEQSVRRGVKIEVNDDEVLVTRVNNSKPNKSFHGLYRSLIANMIQGVTEGYKKELEIHGVGYRGFKKGENLELFLGFSHPVDYVPLEGVSIDMPDENTVVVTGVNKQKVGQVAAEIRELRKPEPYKGKGVRYKGEEVKRKAGKSASVSS